MTLEESIKQLPDSAGIYQYFDINGRLLYVGKAKSLAKRVKSYFYFSPKLRVNPNLSSRISKMISQTVSLNYIVVNSEHDALILENSLIKQLVPKYNILLRDDKTYPYIYIDYGQKYPRFEITRKIIKSSTIKYYGPYSVGARDILDSVYELCSLVQKKGSLASKKLCLYHQIGKCLGPCELEIPQERYQKEIDFAAELIQNKKTLLKKLEEKMLFYAENLRFEEAKEIRDRCERISRSEVKSEIDFASKENYDIFAIAHTEAKAAVVRIFMRDGKIISSSHDTIALHEGCDADELYSRALMEFYAHGKPPIIAPILVASDFEGKEILQEHLTALFEKKATVHIPKTGKKKQLIDLALLNAAELLKKEFAYKKNGIEEEIKNLFGFQRTPERIEIFDNSHMSGMATVGAMAVYANGAFDKKSYRIYHLSAKDEYGQMREMLTRRCEGFEKNPPPDLWVLDGGATLLHLALEILESHGLFLDVIAIAKEKVDAKAHRAKGKAKDILHSKESILKLQESDKRLHFVQKLRDEAHRCALNFHKKTKLKHDQESKLLTLKGISQAKIIKLLNHFGTFEALREASIQEISCVLNIKDANIIKDSYL
ncbi:excinuclease ABC subunit UvrC [Sulfurimonas sp.]|nr:excinuclease ABC subunit UvrC [Sulfurimonas sp.]MDD3452196.1 excinuclease ABC subunit UvrC [Sulfurimonas sp.]